MNISAIKEQANIKAWEYLPNADTLSQYFKQSDLFELSKVCKKYRAQLKPYVLKKLSIKSETIESYRDRSHSNDSAYEQILNCLRLDFAGSYHLVKQVTIEISLSTKFANSFFNLFDKLLNIKIHNYKRYNLNSLIGILNNCENLQHITLSSKFKKIDPILDNEYHNLFYRLKSIEMLVPSPISDLKSPLDIITPSFTNLENLTIINDYMLYKLSNGIPSLLYVDFYYENQFCLADLNKFICNNPQLRQIYISVHNLNEAIINSILALKNLYKLIIVFSGAEVDNFNILTENYSIKHYVYTGYGTGDYDVTIGVLKMCKSLKVYETSFISNYHTIIGSEFPKIDTFLLNSMFNLEIGLIEKDFSKFKEVKFRGGCNFGYIADQLLKLPNIEWVPKQEYTRDTDEFTLVKNVNLLK